MQSGHCGGEDEEEVLPVRVRAVHNAQATGSQWAHIDLSSGRRNGPYGRHSGALEN